MKRNLVTILALTAIALSAGACNKKKKEEKPLDLTLPEVFEFENGAFVNQGKKVNVSDLCVYGNYGNTYVVGVAYEQEESPTDLQGLEIELNEKPAWQGVTKGRYAKVDVHGTLENVDGRPVLKNGTLDILAEAQYDDNGDRIVDEQGNVADGAYSAGYWGTSIFVRDYFDEYFGREMNGVLMEGIMQLASVPEEITTESGSEFYVVFPGEDTDLEDFDNYSPIKVTIPAGIEEENVTKINGIFADFSAGDFIDMMGITRWESGAMGIVAENWWGKYADAPAAADVPVIYDNWADVSTDYSPIYNEEMIDLSAADETDPLGAPFSFVVDDSDFNSDPRDYWVDAYKDVFVRVANPEKSGMIKITANLKAAKRDAYVSAVVDKAEAAGWEIDNHASQGYILCLGKDAEEHIDKQILIMVSEQAVTLYYTALRLIVDADFASVALASAAYNVRAGEVLGATFETALPAASSEAITNVNFNWGNELYYYNKYQVAAYEYKFEISFAEATTAEQKTALLQGYQAAVAGAGFVEAYQSSFSIQGLWNATTGEFVVDLGLSKNGTLVIDVMILRGAMASAVSLKPTSSAEMIAMINGEYAGWNGASAQYFPTTTSSVTSFDLGELAPESFGFLDNTYNDMDKSWGYTPYFVASIIYGRDLAQEDVALFVAQLTAAGFVQASHAAFGAGYWNATTYEFIKVSFEEDTLYVGFGLVPSVLAGQVITVANA